MSGIVAGKNNDHFFDGTADAAKIAFFDFGRTQSSGRIKVLHVRDIHRNMFPKLYDAGELAYYVHLLPTTPLHLVLSRSTHKLASAFNTRCYE